MARGLTVGQVGRAAGVSAKAVRLYEERGLLPLAERSQAGYRLFTTQDVETTRFIRRARGLGLGLDAVSEVLVLRQAGQQPCNRVEAVARLRPPVSGPDALEEVPEAVDELLWAGVAGKLGGEWVDFSDARSPPRTTSLHSGKTDRVGVDRCVRSPCLFLVCHATPQHVHHRVHPSDGGR